MAKPLKKLPNPIDKHVGSRIRMRRMMMNMSQEKLGDAVKLTFQQVQKYEKGSNRVSASRLQQFSNILQVPIPFFFDGAPNMPGFSPNVDPPSPAYVQDFLSSSDGLALTKSFQRIKSNKLKRAVVGMVEEIVAQQ